MTLLFFSNIFQNIRQYFYPEPFRILNIESNIAKQGDIRQLIAELQNVLAEHQDNNHSSIQRTESERIDSEFLTDLATRLWRIRSGLLVPGGDTPFKEVGRSFRYLERLIDTLERHEIRIIDKTGDFYDSGMMIEVIASEPMKGIRKDIIKETLEPMILKGDRIIQVAKVVIGTPEEKNIRG